MIGLFLEEEKGFASTKARAVAAKGTVDVLTQVTVCAAAVHWLILTYSNTLMSSSECTEYILSLSPMIFK